MAHRHKWLYFGKFKPRTGEYFTYPCIAGQIKENWAIYRCVCGMNKAVLLEDGQPDYFIDMKRVYADSLEKLLFGEPQGAEICLNIN